MAVLKWSLLRAAFHFYLPYMSHAISRQLYLNEISPMSHQSDHSFLNMINTRNIRRRYVWMGPSRFFPFWCSTWFLPCVKWRVIGHHKDLRARWTRRSVLRQLPGDRATFVSPLYRLFVIKKEQWNAPNRCCLFDYYNSLQLIFRSTCIFKKHLSTLFNSAFNQYFILV